MRKSLMGLASDVRSFLSGATPLREALDAGNKWLHPIDCRFMLDDADTHFGPFDDAGIPMQRFGDLDPVYVPSRVAAFAFAHWHRAQADQCAESMAAFVTAAQWFLNQPDGRIEHGFPLAGMDPPWLSCLAQGEAMSILARYYSITKDTRCIDQARAAFDWMAKPIDGGGTCDILPDGRPFLEEYPGTRHRHVLNGCLYGVIGMLDLLRVATYAEVSAFSRNIVDATAATIKGWEARGWSLYDLPQEGAHANFNTPGYQRVHIALLRYVGYAMNVPEFLSAAERLTATLEQPLSRIRALVGKVKYRMAGGW